MIAAFINDDLAGNAAISCIENHIKLKHRASFGISIKEKYWNHCANAELEELMILES